MIFRLLLLFLIVWFLFWIIKKQFTSNEDVLPSKEKKPVEDMVACAVCGTHVPKSLAVVFNGKNYCSQEHAEQDAE